MYTYLYGYCMSCVPCITRGRRVSLYTGIPGVHVLVLVLTYLSTCKVHTVHVPVHYRYPGTQVPGYLYLRITSITTSISILRFQLLGQMNPMVRQRLSCVFVHKQYIGYTQSIAQQMLLQHV